MGGENDLYYFFFKICNTKTNQHKKKILILIFEAGIGDGVANGVRYGT